MRKLLSQHRVKFPLTAIIAGIVVTAAMLSFVVYKDLVRIENDFLVETTDIRDNVQRRINAAEEIIHSLATLYGASTNVDADQFRIFVEHVLDRHQYVSSVMYLPLVVHSERQKYEEVLRENGFLLFSLTEKDETNNYINAQPKQHYFPIKYHEPLSPVSSVQLGYDIS